MWPFFYSQEFALPLLRMKGITLSEHIRQSKIAVAANKIKGNRHGQILSMLYADPYHFIEEIIQNAEDACRNLPNFEDKGILRVLILDNAIDIYHNGKAFDEQDLMAISTFASTSKKGTPDINMIGKFGIGFRSVYGISENPEIHSGEHHYRILDYEILETCESRSTHEFTTLIRLPFKKDLDSKIIESTRNKLLQLDHTLLLFLTHLRKIEVESGAKRLSIQRENILLQKDIYKTSLQSSGINSKMGNYLVFRKNTHGKQECAIAFCLGAGTDHFIPSENKPVAVYFPTQYSLKHSFLTHGRFTTNPTREQIIFNHEYCPENFKISTDLGDLLFKSFKFLRKEKYLNSSFYSLFNWNIQNPDPLHESIESSIDKFLREEKSLQNAENQYKECKSLCIPEHDLLRNLTKNKDIFNIWSRFDFLHETLCRNETFLQYLQRKHKLKKADLDSLAFHIRQHPEFLKKKKFSELTIFYQILSEHTKYWDTKHADRYYSLRYSQIIPDTKKELKAPFHTDGRPAIFLGEIKGKVPLVHPDLAANSENRNFFKMLGIPEGSPGLAEAEKLIAAIRMHNANPNLFRLYQLYIDGNSTLKDRISTLLLQTNCIRAIESRSGEKKLDKPGEIYLQKPELEKFFSNINVSFISSDLYKYFESNEISGKETELFLKNIGVQAFPKIIPIKNTLNEHKKKELRGEIEIHPIVKEEITDFSIEGLDEFLSFPSFEASVALWALLCNMPEEYFEASYTFESYVRSECVSFIPDFIQTLKNTAFLYDKNMNARSGNEINADEMHDAYEKNAGNYNRILNIFQIDGSLSSSLNKNEEDLIRFIRSQKIDPLKFISNEQMSRSDHEYIFTKYNADLSESHQKGGANFDQWSQMAQSLPFNSDYQPDIEALDFFLDSTTQRIREHLLKNVYAKSKSISIAFESSGILKIMENGDFLSWVFIGQRNDFGGYIMMHPDIEQLLLERPNRRDIIAYIADKQHCMLVESENIDKFLKNNILLTLRRMKFTR